MDKKGFFFSMLFFAGIVGIFLIPTSSAAGFRLISQSGGTTITSTALTIEMYIGTNWYYLTNSGSYDILVPEATISESNSFAYNFPSSLTETLASSSGGSGTTSSGGSGTTSSGGGCQIGCDLVPTGPYCSTCGGGGTGSSS